jgi:glutamyl-tRNA reductase
MSDLKIIHRTFFKEVLEKSLDSQALVWKTCQREIYFFDAQLNFDFEPHLKDQVYSGLEAEVFLAEVLCGLKSSLIGETEVFGQFKIWWKNLPQDSHFKLKFQNRIETLFALVKTVRENALCGHGSQSYGSLLRKNLKAGEPVDIIGADHLVQEILPWIKNKSAHRIWCRNPEKAKANQISQAQCILSLEDHSILSEVVVIAAPLSHAVLTQWLVKRGLTKGHRIFDFRSDSAEYHPPIKLALHFKLEDFSSKFDVHQIEIEKKAKAALKLIQKWRDTQESKVQVRPYGWDDL